MAAKLESSFLGRARGAQGVPERPFRDELLSVERLDERARSLAARFTVDPSRRGARSVFPRFDDNVRVLRDAYRTLADDVHRRRVRHGRRGVAPRQLPPGRLRDPGRPPEPPARLLPRAAQARRARAGRERPRLRARRGADPPQRQPPRPPPARALARRLPDGRPAHHRRALGVAEHAEARARREPPAARGRDARAPARPGAPPTGTWRGSTPRGRGCRRRCRARCTPRSSSSSSSALREYGPRLAASAPASTRTSPPAARPRRRRSAESTSARPPRRCRSRTSSPACGSAPPSTGPATSRR